MHEDISQPRVVGVRVQFVCITKISVPVFHRFFCAVQAHPGFEPGTTCCCDHWASNRPCSDERRWGSWGVGEDALAVRFQGRAD